MLKGQRRRSIVRKLDQLEAGGHTYRVSRPLEALRTVILSDMHKGTGTDDADDFRGSTETYVRALHHYFDEGYDLVVLGDGEEMWEASWTRIRDAYGSVFEAERTFLGAGRYTRIYGNHDLRWQTAERVAAELFEALPDVPVYEAMEMDIVDGDRTLGRIFLVHGHQGTILSDYLAPFARLAVRHLWGNVQRVFRIQQPTPSSDYELLRTHDVTMRDWASQRSRTVLISGHTHRAIFNAPEIEQWLEAELATACAIGDSARSDELHTVTKKVCGLRPRDLPGAPFTNKPCYFNSGCCLTRHDRHLDAIELADGQIRLVKWCDGDTQPRRARHRTADLRAVLDACEGGV